MATKNRNRPNKTFCLSISTSFEETQEVLVESIQNVTDFHGDALVIALLEDAEGARTFPGLNEATQDWLNGLIESGEVQSKSMKVAVLHSPLATTCRIIVAVGLGSADELDAGVLFRAAASAAKALAGKPGRVRVGYTGFAEAVRKRESKAEQILLLSSAVAGSLVGGVGQDLFRKEKNLTPAESVLWAEVDSEVIARGKALAESIDLGRRLVNLPANYLTPASFAEEAEKVAKECGLEIEIWDEKKLEEEKCGALLAVGRASANKPRLCILKYPGKKDGGAPIALVGKGVTFDSGGLSLKPSDSMLTMKCDMAGAASVLATMQAVAQIGVSRPVYGVIGLVENMISSDAFRLGDVLTARSGKTIEVHNTDAEGRLVLADALDVAKDLNPSCMIDLATLTGACCVALGNDIVGLMGNHELLSEKFLAASKKAGEWVWPLPMHGFFKEQIASKVADIKNVGEGRWGGAITAAKFLEEFVGEVPWIHLDIAGPSFHESPKGWMDAGGTGVMVRSLVEFIESKEDLLA